LRPAIVHDRTCAISPDAKISAKPLQNDTFADEQLAPDLRSATYTLSTMLQVAMTF